MAGAASPNGLITMLSGLCCYFLTESLAARGGGGAAGAAGALASMLTPKPKAITVDDQQPTTTLQFRFVGAEPDGKKMVVASKEVFNQHVHTVADVRRKAAALAKQGEDAVSLFVGFPPKLVGDEALTVDAAGLCGAAITIRPNG